MSSRATLPQGGRERLTKLKGLINELGGALNSTDPAVTEPLVQIELLLQQGIQEADLREATVPVPDPRVRTGTNLPNGWNQTGAISEEKTGSGNHGEPDGTDPFVTLEAFLEMADRDPAPSWLIDSLVPDAGRLLIVGAPSSGKTWQALNILQRARSQGRSCFLIEEEGRRVEVAGRLRRVGLQGSVYVAHCKAVDVGQDSILQAIAARLEKEDAPVLVLDPLASIWRGNENETRDANELTRRLNQLCSANPRALLVVLHHSSKAANRNGGNPIDAARGSSVFGGWFDTTLNLSHVPSPPGSGQVRFKTMVAKMRDGERGAEFAMRLDLKTGVFEQKRLAGPSAEDGKEEEVLRALRESPTPLNKSRICDAVGGNRSAVLSLVDRLFAAGRLTCDSKGRYQAVKVEGEQ